ncbi:hypothetical protein LZ554_008624 [Drepanopeziza brunnea f. sp. 'monogermtubi']|nr:hypothetical protein LZ554_008624 [Drepanopeziza brunnea f. sp. 'monogermtubi']
MSDPRDTEHKAFLKYSDDDAAVDDIQSESSHRLHARSSNHSRLMGYALTFLLTSALWFGLLLLLAPSPASNPSNHAPILPAGPYNLTSSSTLIMCPNTTTAARAAGCKYDLLLNNWVPAPCWDQDYLDEYVDDGSWAAFADKALTIPVKTSEEMSEREFYWTSARDHVNHCATMWKKQFSAMFYDTGVLDSVVASPFHTDHCATYLTENHGDEPTMVEIGFAGCWVKN